MRPAHLADPATAVRPSCRPSPYRPNRCRTAQTVPTRSRRLFHGPAAPPQPKGAEGTAERARSWQGGCGGKGLQREGVAEGRDYGREGCNRKARSRIRQDCGWQDPQPESRRVTGHSRKSPQLAGVAEGRGTIGSARSRIRQGPAGSPTEFFAGFVPFASLNIRFERVQTASQPYFYSRKRFTPRPHTHQIQPVAAPRQRSAPRAEAGTGILCAWRIPSPSALQYGTRRHTDPGVVLSGHSRIVGTYLYVRIFFRTL